MAHQLRDKQKYEQLQSRYVGIGNSDTTKDEWLTNVQRDSLVSLLGNPPILQQLAIASGERTEVARMKLLERIVNVGTDR